MTSGGTSSVGVQHLSVSSSAQEVSVSTAQNLLETSQAQITSTFDTQSITDLPTGGGLDKLTLLIPGVVRTLGDNFSNTNGVGFSSNGQRGRSNNFEIDGQSNNDNSVAGPQFFFRNEDALQELNVITNNYGAQYGRDAGSIVNYITKSGTNSFHGTAFENYFGSWGSSLTQGQKAVQFGFCAPGQTTDRHLLLHSGNRSPRDRKRVWRNHRRSRLQGQALLLRRPSLPPHHQRRIALRFQHPHPHSYRPHATADRLSRQPVRCLSGQSGTLLCEVGQSRRSGFKCGERNRLRRGLHE